MRKIIVLLSIVMLLVTGCSISKLDDTDIGKNMKILLSEKVKMHNVFYDGYKYYLPKGVSFVEKEDFNAVLKDNKNNKYYLYVDAISYYHKTEVAYEVNDDAHYSKRLNYNKKTGYVQIDEVDSEYFVQFVFNYVKIEAYVAKADLTDAIINMCYILRSVEFNDAVLESLVGENILDYKEENYTLFKDDSSKESFLDVVEREETDRYKRDVEDEKIDLDN